MRWIVGLLIVLLVAGCGGECKVKSDCSSKKCYEVSCTDKICEYDAIDDCCGNKKCEAPAENKCACPTDCGECEGDGEGYLSMYCNQANECLVGLDEKTVKAESLNSGDLNNRAALFQVDADFNQPFNLDTDRLFLTVLLKEPKSSSQNIKITKIEVVGEKDKRQKITLGEKTVSRGLWKSGHEIEEEIYLDPKTNEKEAKLKNVQVIISFDYEQVSKTSVTDQQSTIIFKLPNVEFVYVNPDTERICPPNEEWDDGNNGTQDLCSSQTNFFVEHIPIPGVCGNFMCDERQGENKCNCENDCGPCSGDVGAFMEILCDVENNCISVIKVTTEPAPQTIFDEQRVSNFKINSEIKFEDPFDVSRKEFSMKFYTSEVETDEVSGIVLERVRILEGDNLWMEETIEETLGSDPITLSKGIDPTFIDYETELAVEVKIWYKWIDVSSEETKFGNHGVNLGKVNLLNPG